MDKRYQVFVSSTYTDLKDERRAIIQTLVEMDCIPAGIGHALTGSFTLDVYGGKPDWSRNVEAARALGAELNSYLTTHSHQVMTLEAA